MQTVQGYYDGVSIIPLEKLTLAPHQTILISIAEISDPVLTEKEGMRGALSDFANPSLTEKEKGAWERAAVKKHGHA